MLQDVCRTLKGGLKAGFLTPWYHVMVLWNTAAW